MLASNWLLKSMTEILSIRFNGHNDILEYVNEMPRHVSIVSVSDELGNGLDELKYGCELGLRATSYVFLLEAQGS